MKNLITMSVGVSAGLLLITPAYAGGPSFDLVAGALDPQACGGSGCWTNHVRVTDLDGDDDLDILLVNYSDFFTGSNDPEPLVMYANDGSGNFTNVSATALDDFAGNLHQVAVGDVDGDGFRDIYGPAGNGDAPVLFINDGAGNFTDEADVRLPGAPYPRSAGARMGDVDSDGDLDIFVADGYATAGPPFGHLYINDGLGMFTEARGAIPDTIAGHDIDDVEFFDADGDFDLDIVVNAHNQGIGALWLNDGNGMFTAGGTLAPPADGHNHYNVAPCDVDGDGDLDLWIENIGGDFTEQLQINDGNGNFTDETSTRVTGNPTQVDDNGVVCADIDDDGDLDGVVLSLQTPERFLENDGTGHFTYVAGVFPPPTNATLWGEFGDLDGDGRFDLVTSEGEINSSDEVYIANEQVPVDSHAPILRAVQVPETSPTDGEVLVHFAVSDREVNDEGPRLARAWIVVDPAGAATEIDATAMGGDLFRVLLPVPTDDPVTYQACAQDPVGNSDCSPEATYDPLGNGGTGGSDTGTDPTDGGNHATGATTHADDSGGPSTVTAANTDGATGGDDGDTDTDTDPGADGDDGGCGCRQSSGGSPAWLLLFGLGACLRRRRRG